MPTFTDVTVLLSYESKTPGCESKNAGTCSGHRRCFNESGQVTFRFDRSVLLLWGLFDLQLCQFIKNLFGMLAGLHLLFDVQNLAVLAHDESDAVRESSIVQDAVSFGDFRVGIAENGIVEFQRFGEFGVFLDRVATGCEVSDVVLTQGLTARTERFAFGRSATSEGFGVPGDNNRLFILELRKFVGLSVAALHFKFGSFVPHFEFGSIRWHSD